MSLVDTVKNMGMETKEEMINTITVLSMLLTMIGTHGSNILADLNKMRDILLDETMDPKIRNFMLETAMEEHRDAMAYMLTGHAIGINIGLSNDMANKGLSPALEELWTETFNPASIVERSKLIIEDILEIDAAKKERAVN